MTEARILIVLMLAGMAATPATARDRALGSAVQANVAAQVVNLRPSHAGVPMEGSDGQRAEAAITRYRDGRVTPLQSISSGSQVGAAAGQRGAGAAAQGPR
jgi:type IV pilus biogenesis protein CpaD/CtpE